MRAPGGALRTSLVRISKTDGIRSGPDTDGGNQLEADLPCLMSMEDSMRSTASVLIEAPFWWKEMVDGTKIIVPGTALSSNATSGTGLRPPAPRDAARRPGRVAHIDIRLKLFHDFARSKGQDQANCGNLQ